MESNKEKNGIVKKIKQLSKKAKVIITIVLCAVLVIGAGSYIGYKNYQREQEVIRKKKLAQQKKKAREEVTALFLSETIVEMYEGAQASEDVCNKVQAVWHDSIYDEYSKDTAKYISGTKDFNDALQNLFNDKSFAKKMSKIQEKVDSVDDSMKRIRKICPPKYKEEFSDVKTAYESFTELTSLALDASGKTYNQFSNDFNDADSECAKDLKRLSIYTNS